MMYTNHGIPRANDDWGKENENEKENSQRASNMSNNCQNYEEYTRKGGGSHKATTHVHCDYESKNTDKADQAYRSRTSWYDEAFRQPHCNCTATDSPDLAQEKPTVFTSNNSSPRKKPTFDNNQETGCCEGLEERDINCRRNSEEMSQEYTSAGPSVPNETHRVNRKGSRRKCCRTDTKSGKKQGKPDEAKGDEDDVNKRKPDTAKSVRKEPKRPNRSKKRAMPRKPSHMPRGNRLENTVWGMDWTWIIDGALFLLKTGLAKLFEVIPFLIRTSKSVLWYLLVILVLLTCFVLSWLVSLLYKIPAFLWNKTRAVKTDYEEFLKRKHDVVLEPQQEQEQQQRQYQSDLGSSDETISQLLASRHVGAYDVLGVSELATDDEIKRKYRDMAKIVHPDKNAHPESGEAFQILQSAFESISDEKKRMDYQFEKDKQEFENEFGSFIDLMKERINELKTKIMCSMCNKSHPRLLTDRLVYAARYCAECHVKHPAKEGDVWVETSHMGFKYYCYLCLDCQVFEVTEWASCQGLLQSRPNAHEVYFSVKSNRPCTPWDDLFNEMEQPSWQPSQNHKKKRNKSNTKSTGKNKRR